MTIIATLFGIFVLLPTGEQFEGTDGAGMDVEQLEAVLLTLESPLGSRADSCQGISRLSGDF